MISKVKSIKLKMNGCLMNNKSKIKSKSKNN